MAGVPTVPAEKFKIFISYRRADARGFAGWLRKELADRLSDYEVLRDLDSLVAGDRYTHQLDEQLASSDAVIAVIGPNWLTAANENGRRLDDPKDRLRLELETALQRGVPLIPVLIEGAQMPPEDRLPESLKPLCEWQAVKASDGSFESDVDKLIGALRRTLEKQRDADATGESAPRRRLPVGVRRLPVLAVSFGVLLLVILLVVVGVVATEPPTKSKKGGSSKPPPVVPQVSARTVIERTLQRHFREIKEGRYPQAWRDLSTNLDEVVGPESHWIEKKRQEELQLFTLKFSKIVMVSDGREAEAKIEKFRTYSKEGCENLKGGWLMVKSGSRWLIGSADGLSSEPC